MATGSSREPFDFGQGFRALQQQLEAALGLGRAVANHPGNRGDSSELNWRNMLADYLPERYRVSQAFVVDVNGTVSDQIDLVIHDRHFSPLLFNVGEAMYIPSESVLAVFEIKQTISKAHIDYAGKKIASVRQLHRTSSPFTTATGQSMTNKPRPILGGLLALDSDWKRLFGPPLTRALAQRPEDEWIDLCCVLRAGSFEAPAPSSPKARADCDDPTIALTFFMLRLFKRLQDMGNVPAISLDRYTKIVWPSFEVTSE